MTTTVRTTYSTYEIDQATNQVRRLGGDNDPTRNQGKDGEWMHYTSLESVGAALLIVWGMDGATLRRTLTSDIISTEGDPLNIATDAGPS